MMKLTPEEALTEIAKENRITLVYENGFGENSPTAKIFREEIYSDILFEEHCITALLGLEYAFETHLNNSDFIRNTVSDLVKEGEWDYIILHERKDPISYNILVYIENVLNVNR
ncbi:hypothetical protein [Paenibacillus sp. Leaf72]|uniref:hypothetical protein n=1 Tax=Paenibacillus sp. Leaf72 TaxID=1736234 RepID=UPI0006FE935C|nr:hypothetical protein [Paenibacillus sp. Leaf72]KQN96803.1 hypothetical protein ASF12_22280 [Paenibacillus sp. Leaf72]